MIRRLLATLLALVCCFALASCNDSSAPGTGDGSSASAGPSIPPAAKADDEEGAKQFASYWIDTLNEATTSGDTKHLKELSEKSCAACRDFIDQVDKVYADGGHVETDGFQVKNVVMEAGMTAEAAGMLVTVSAAPRKIYRTPGAKPERTAANAELRLRMVIDREGDHWLVKDLIPS